MQARLRPSNPPLANGPKPPFRTSLNVLDGVFPSVPRLQMHPICLEPEVDAPVTCRTDRSALEDGNAPDECGMTISHRDGTKGDFEGLHKDGAEGRDRDRRGSGILFGNKFRLPTHPRRRSPVLVPRWSRSPVADTSRTGDRNNPKW